MGRSGSASAGSLIKAGPSCPFLHKLYITKSNFLEHTTARRRISRTKLVGLGWVYVPYAEAPEELRECWDDEQSRMRDRFRDQETVGLFGGLDGRVHFKGIGLTPLGKEKEARVGQVLAGAGRMAWWGETGTGVWKPETPCDVLRRTVEVVRGETV